MSVEDARKVVSRAVLEAEFRTLLFEDPDQALAEYELSPQEREALRSMPAETIEDFANNLEERISMSLVLLSSILERQEAERITHERYGTEREAAERSAAERAVSERSAAERGVVERAAAERETVERAAAEREAVERDALARAAAERVASERSAERSWLVRLASALGFGGGKGGEHDVM